MSERFERVDRWQLLDTPETRRHSAWVRLSTIVGVALTIAFTVRVASLVDLDETLPSLGTEPGMAIAVITVLTGPPFLPAWCGVIRLIPAVGFGDEALISLAILMWISQWWDRSLLLRSVVLGVGGLLPTERAARRLRLARLIGSRKWLARSSEAMAQAKASHGS
jgi:hypothetical protein